LEEICEFIAKGSEHYAKTFAQKIVALIETIPEFPLTGRVVPEYGREDFRERIFQNYRIVYRVKSEAVEIVAIVYGARLLPELE
jgi:plasmid stabilization system protein ParE